MPKRILFLITIQFSVRYLLRTGLLEKVREFAVPIVYLSWKDKDLYQELTEKGAEVYEMPAYKTGKWYNFLRSIMDVWHAGRTKSASAAIDAYRINLISGKSKRRWRNVVVKFLGRLIRYVPYSARIVMGVYQPLLRKDTNFAEVRKKVSQLSPDAIVSLTPFIGEEQIILAAAKDLKIKMITSILSFDNITTRNFIPTLFDHYLVWNEYNRTELKRIYKQSSKKTIDIVGPAQFDFYWKPELIWEKEEWLQRLNIPSNKKIILFGAGHFSIVPQEPVWLAQLDEAIESGEILGNPIILFRRHPVDPIERWLPTLEKAKHVIRDDPWVLNDQSLAKTDISIEHIQKLCSTLIWSDVHVNASSTMTVDGAIFDKPQIGPAYDDSVEGKYDRMTKELYLREHYLPITESGGLHIVYNRNEFIQAVNEALLNPSQRAKGRQQLVKEICHFSDGKSTDRVISRLRKLLGHTREN